MWTKICGLTREEDVRVCLDLDIDLTGFIFHPSSPRCVHPGQVARFPCGKSGRVGVFVRHTAEQIVDCIQDAGLDQVQLHGGQDPEICRRIGPERVLKVLWPQKYPHARAMQEDLDRFGPVCSAFVLDSGRSGGGHGRTVSVSWLSELVFPRPWFLAGGLGPHTLPDLLRTCRPDGLDLNSGVEISPGIKDQRLIEKCLRILTSKE
jgi:phosphoribosylanthranilate isomerase